VRTTGGGTARGVALGVGVGVGVGVRVPGKLKCSSPGIVGDALFCASAAPEAPSSNIVSAPRIVEITEIPTNAP